MQRGEGNWKGRECGPWGVAGEGSRSGMGEAGSLQNAFAPCVPAMQGSTPRLLSAPPTRTERLRAVLPCAGLQGEFFSPGRFDFLSAICLLFFFPESPQPRVGKTRSVTGSRGPARGIGNGR